MTLKKKMLSFFIYCIATKNVKKTICTCEHARNKNRDLFFKKTSFPNKYKSKEEN